MILSDFLSRQKHDNSNQHGNHTYFIQHAKYVTNWIL